MANLKKTKEKAVAKIDAAIAILHKFPSLHITSTGLSFDLTANPFPFLVDLLKHTVGYDKIIEILSKFLVIELPAVELAVKGVILSNLKNILSCSINPIISDGLLRKGVAFDLKQLDMTDILRYSPLSTVGKNYYYGCDDAEIAEDVKGSDDMNALIWYMKTKASGREVWHRTSESGEREGVTDKQKKDDGIVTLEFHETSNSMTDALGNGQSAQTPYNNCLQVFIGHTRKAYADSINAAQKSYDDMQSAIIALKAVKEKAESLLEEYSNKKSEVTEKYKNGKMTQLVYAYNISEIEKRTYLLNYLLYGDATAKYYDDEGNEVSKKQTLRELDVDEMNSLIKDIQTALATVGVDGTFDDKEEYYSSSYSIDDLIDQANGLKTSRQITLNNVLKSDGQYRDITRNYYYRHTLIEFDTDFVMKMKLFSSRELAARLIDGMTGVLSMDISFSYKHEIIRNEITNMVQGIVETDGSTISDCFFSFSNDDYDQMMRTTELKKAGLYSYGGSGVTTNQIDAESILESLNGLSEGASEETMQTIISGALTEISGNVSDWDWQDTRQDNFGVQMDIIQDLLTNLSVAMGMAVLSPKIYMLFLFNLEVLGQSTNFSLKGFINQFKNLIAGVIREIRDQIISFLLKEIMIIIKDLAVEITAKIELEKAQYYAALIKRLLKLFKRHKTEYDWTMDDVNYADIDSDDEAEEPSDAGC